MKHRQSIINYSLYFRRGCIDFLRKSGLMPTVNWLSNRKNSLKKIYYKAWGRNPLDAVYNDKFFSENIYLDEVKGSSVIVAKCIINRFSPNSVVDVGCGPALFLRELEKEGVNVLGIDGSVNAIKHSKIDPSKILLMDVTEKFDLGKKFDLVICFEVAEHIPTKYSDTLVDNLINLADTILFTAAPKGQGGTDHINEQPREYWINLFSKRSFSYQDKEIIELKRQLQKENCAFWVYENLFLFKKL